MTEPASGRRSTPRSSRSPSGFAGRNALLAVALGAGLMLWTAAAWLWGNPEDEAGRGTTTPEAAATRLESGRATGATEVPDALRRDDEKLPDESAVPPVGQREAQEQAPPVETSSPSPRLALDEVVAAYLERRAATEREAAGDLDALAWILATHHDARVRDADEAVRLAERLVHELRMGDPEYRETLAAAYAAAGRFDEAARTLRPLLKRRSDGERFAKQLQLYESGLPLRESFGVLDMAGLEDGIAGDRRRLAVLVWTFGRRLQEEGRNEAGDAALQLALELGSPEAKGRLDAGRQVKQAESRASVADLEKDLRDRPDDPQVLLSCGRRYRRLGRFRDASRCLNRALELRPDWAEPAAELAWVLASRAEAGSRQAAAAIRLAQHACEVTSFDDPEKLDALAAAYAAGGAYEKATATARRAIKRVEVEGDAEQLEKLEMRLQLYDRKIPFRGDADSFAEVGKIALEKGQYDIAAARLSEALKRDSGHVAALYHMGVCRQRQGKLSMAATYYRAALALEPQWASPAINLAAIYTAHPDPNERDPQRAVELAEFACKATRFEDAAALDTLAAAYAVAGRLSDALRMEQMASRAADQAGNRSLQQGILGRLNRYRQIAASLLAAQTPAEPPDVSARAAASDDVATARLVNSVTSADPGTDTGPNDVEPSPHPGPLSDFFRGLLDPDGTLNSPTAH